MTKRVVSFLVLLAACSPFAAGGSGGDGDTTNDAGGTSSGTTSPTPDAGTSGGEELGDASLPPATAPLAWEGDEIASWHHANISPFNAAETTDCCGSCLEATATSCGPAATKHCDDTDARAGDGIGTFVSGSSASGSAHAKDGLYAWHEFVVTPGTSYDVKFRFTKVAAFGPDPADAAWKVTLYDGTKDVFSTGDVVPCAAAGGCIDDSKDERSFGPAYMQQTKATVVIKLESGAACTIGGVTSVEADVDYVRLVPHP